MHVFKQYGHIHTPSQHKNTSYYSFTVLLYKQKLVELKKKNKNQVLKQL